MLMKNALLLILASACASALNATARELPDPTGFAILVTSPLAATGIVFAALAVTFLIHARK